MLRVVKEDISVAVSVLARAFIEDPIMTFVFPQPESRLEALTAFFRVFVADGVKRGNVLLAPEEKGAIVWYPASVSVFDDTFAELQAEIGAIATNFGGIEAAERLEQLGKKLETKAPTVVHAEVFWIAILPEARGQGIGGVLLQPVLDYADAENVGCYLVSSNPRNITFYERHGFRQAVLIPINSNLSMIGMWRDSNRK